MSGPIGSEGPSAEGVSYRDVLTSIIKRFGRLSGLPSALNVARKIPGLSVDEEGNVLDYKTSDPLGTITLLIDQYEVIYGEIARALALRAAEPLAADNDTLLQQAGLLEPVPEQVRIVLVDDHFLFSDGMARLLEAQPDMKVVGTAGTVSEATVLISKVMPHLVLMDVTLPDGSGIEATRAILEIAPGTKVVILTVYEDEEQVFEAIRAGAIGYLFKSARAIELIETLRGVMRGEVGIRGATARRVMAEFARLSPGGADRGVTLTAREIEVLRELADGATNQEIAKRLVISENTVKNHIRNVLFKLHLHSRRDAGDYARRHGLISRRRPPGSQPG